MRARAVAWVARRLLAEVDLAVSRRTHVQVRAIHVDWRVKFLYARRDDRLRNRRCEMQLGPDREAGSSMLHWFHGQYTRFGEGVKYPRGPRAGGRQVQCT